MRVLHVIYSLRRGGAERVVVDLAKSLARKGHTNRICLVSPTNAFLDELSDPTDPPVAHSALSATAAVRFLPSIPLLYRRLKAEVAGFKPDIVHAHLRPDGALCGLLRGVPVVRTIQNANPLPATKGSTLSNRVTGWLERRSFLAPNAHIVACSTAAKAALQPYVSQRGRPTITVIPNGIDLGRLAAEVAGQTHVRGGGRPVILTVGTLYKLKNQRMAILALNELRRMNVDCELWILGEGPEKESLARLAEELGITDRVRLVGRFDRVVDYLAKGTLYWSTSFSEGFSIANLEAMWMGLATIVTDVDGNTEMLAPWPELRVPPDDFMQLATVSARILADSTRLSETSTAMQRYVTERYSTDHMADRYIQYYESVLTESANRRI